MNYKISAVSYANTYPFLYGLKKSSIIKKIDLSLDFPSVCATKLINNQVDIGLVPIAILPQLKEHYIISDFCIGAIGKVNSVLLLSDVPLSQIKTILLDYQSKTSINLTKVLAKHFWNIQPNWETAKEGFETTIHNTTAGVIIGDRTFNLSKKYKYTYDLAEEWQKFTKLPFVFACWVANKKITPEFIKEFNDAIGVGVKNIPEVLNYFNVTENKKDYLSHYLTTNISYKLDDEKQKAIKMFLELL